MTEETAQNTQNQPVQPVSQSAEGLPVGGSPEVPAVNPGGEQTIVLGGKTYRLSEVTPDSPPNGSSPTPAISQSQVREPSSPPESPQPGGSPQQSPPVVDTNTLGIVVGVLQALGVVAVPPSGAEVVQQQVQHLQTHPCLLYTSDAADE